MIEQFIQWTRCSAEQVSDCETVPLKIDGETAGIGVLSGTELHFALAPQWRKRAISRKTTREYFGPLLSRNGYLTTRAVNADQAQLDFIERMGFSFTWNDGQTRHYMLTEMPFGKERN